MWVFVFVYLDENLSIHKYFAIILNRTCTFVGKSKTNNTYNQNSIPWSIPMDNLIIDMLIFQRPKLRVQANNKDEL